MPVIALEWNQTQDITNWFRTDTIKYLLKDGTQIKTVSNNTLTNLGTTPTEELFLNQGVDDYKEFIGDSTTTISMQDNGVLGEGKLFKVTIPSFFDRIDKIEEIG